MKKTCNKTRVFILSLLAILFISCSDSKDEFIDPTSNNGQFLRLGKKEVQFQRGTSTQEIELDTNIEDKDISITIYNADKDWCEAEVIGKKLIIKTNTNTKPLGRETRVLVKAQYVRDMVDVKQKGRNNSTQSIKDDIQLKVDRGEATSLFPGTSRSIEKSFDDDFETSYMAGFSSAQVDLTYYFKDAETVDYVVYHPFQKGLGSFATFEILVRKKGASNFVKVSDCNFPTENADPATIIIPEGFRTDIEAVKFQDVKTGTYSKPICIEMQFFKKAENFDYTTIFKDAICSELKAGITEEQILAIPDVFFQELALDIFSGVYEKEYRVQAYKPYLHPDYYKTSNKTFAPSKRDNITGIYVKEGEELIVFADELNSPIFLAVENLRNGPREAKEYKLAKGLNKIKSETTGLIYISYFVDNPSVTRPLKLNIASGHVNGYFDTQKDEEAVWTEKVQKATYEYFDVVGKYAHLTLPTLKFQANTPNGTALVDKYDEMIRLEWDFMGLFKYNRVPKNRIRYVIHYQEDQYMYATNYYTAYAASTMDLLTNLNRFTTEIWGPAHETGHTCQIIPNFRWHGMTEVTNNILSLHIQTSFGNPSRLIGADNYKLATSEIMDGGIPFAKSEDVFNQLVPFWQLKLYMVDVLGKKDFYKDLCEILRNNPIDIIGENQNTQSIYQLQFVEAACEAAQLDLTKFFKRWGFFAPVSMYINTGGHINQGGGSKFFELIPPQAMMTETNIMLKNYPQPAHWNIHQITDENLDNYR